MTNRVLRASREAQGRALSQGKRLGSATSGILTRVRWWAATVRTFTRSVWLWPGQCHHRRNPPTGLGRSSVNGVAVA